MVLQCPAIDQIGAARNEESYRHGAKASPFNGKMGKVPDVGPRLRNLVLACISARTDMQAFRNQLARFSLYVLALIDSSVATILKSLSSIFLQICDDTIHPTPLGRKHKPSCSVVIP